MANHQKKVDHEIYRDPVDDYELNYDEYLKNVDDDPAIQVSKAPKHRSSMRFGCLMKGLFDGFEGQDLKHISRHLRRKHAARGHAITNLMLSGKMEKLVDRRVRDAIHHFGMVHPDNGRIVGAILGNDLFNFGGLHNILGNTGKVYLDNIMKGKCKRRSVHKFKPKKAEELVKKEGAEPTKGAEPTRKPAAEEVSDYGLDFKEEREKCLKSKTLFEDPEFPANDRSLYYRNRPSANIQWKRPGEIVSNPQLIVQTESRFDVKQGALGDCWFLAALANITLYDALFYRVVPPDQSFTENYAGIFHFQFWHYGKWVDVVVDDRLPTVNGQLYYMHSQSNNEFWSALVEKAYAKLHGGYENLDGGTTAEALEDFTGGITEYFDLRKTDKATVLAAMVKGIRMGSLFGCSIDADANIKEAQLRNGLICGHAYSVTGIHSITYRGNDMTLLRLRNPWGNDKEWNGAWSDGSSEWQYIDEATKKEIDVQFARDGEFWISFDDFFDNFTQMELCNLSASIFDEIAEMTGIDKRQAAASEEQDEEERWTEITKDGEWNSKRGTAGGCNNNPDTYPNNPQYSTFFETPAHSAEDDGNVTVIVAVLQKHRRELRSVGLDLLPIGVSIYQVSNTSKPLDASFFARNRAVARTTVFVNTREVTVHFRIPPGQYVIVPCTFDAYDDAEFFLRVYCNGNLESSLL